MKRKFLTLVPLAMLFTVIFALSASAGFSISEEEAAKLETVDDHLCCYGIGDADLDGDVTSADARLILRYAVGLEEKYSNAQKYRSDVDGDKDIDSADARAALRIAVGLDNPGGHSTIDVTVIRPTCSTEGLMLKYCVNCDKIYSEITTPAEEHAAGAWETVKAPTCKAKGKAELKCMFCGETLKTMELDKADHAWTEWEYPDGKNCLKTSVKTRKCTVCGKTEKDADAPIDAHTFDWVTTKAATCTEDGVLTYGCKNCDYRTNDTKVIKATGHATGFWQTKKAATCTKSGTAVRPCLKCGEELETKTIEALGHNYDTRHYKVTLEPTCSEKGAADATCLNCGKTKKIELDMIPHTYTAEWTVTKAPDCLNSGLEEAECKYCGELSKELPALGHTEVWNTVKQATCLEEGEKQNVCSRCSEVLATETIAKLEHKIGTKLYVREKATCIKDGLGYKVCSLCKTEFDETIPATGVHVKGEKTAVVKKATCMDSRTEAYLCKYCDTVMLNTEHTVYGSYLGHDYGDYVISVKATCTEKGSKYKECSRCGKQLTYSIDATGHKLDKTWVIVKPATCTEPGIQERYCKNCSETMETAEIAKVPHTTEEQTVKPATCAEAGIIEERCTVCLTLVNTKTIDKLPHTESERTVSESTCSKAGIVEVYCTECSEVISSYELPLKDHEYEECLITAPTCTSDGVYGYKCLHCDAVKDTVTFTRINLISDVDITFDPNSDCMEGTVMFSLTNADDAAKIREIFFTYGDGEIGEISLSDDVYSFNVPTEIDLFETIDIIVVSR